MATSVEAFWHLGVEPARLYNVLADVRSWQGDEQPRVIADVEDAAISFAFFDGSRAHFEIIKLGSAALRLNLVHENLSAPEMATPVEQFWGEVIDGIARRLNAGPLTVASAPGKINIFFGVGPLLKSGYHQVASVYQALNLREFVVVAPADDWRVSVTGSLTASHLEGVPTDKSNLVVESAWFVAAQSGIENPAPTSFAIQKHVPVAGGMGGGSADAAAALVAVNQLWCTGLTPKKLRSTAGALGADVPFALLGETAVGTGIGDKLEPIDGVPQLHWVLVPNDFGLSTPAVFAKLDELRAARGEAPSKAPKAEVPAELVSALQSGDLGRIASLLHNDLQEAAVALKPELGKLIDAAKDAGALAAIVSGSGPTLALLAPNAIEAKAIANRMRVYSTSALATSGPAAGARIER